MCERGGGAHLSVGAGTSSAGAWRSSHASCREMGSKSCLRGGDGSDVMVVGAPSGCLVYTLEEDDRIRISRTHSNVLIMCLRISVALRDQPTLRNTKMDFAPPSSRTAKGGLLESFHIGPTHRPRTAPNRPPRARAKSPTSRLDSAIDVVGHVDSRPGPDSRAGEHPRAAGAVQHRDNRDKGAQHPDEAV